MKKWLVALMVIVCLALGAFTVFLRFSEDKEAPEIRFQDDEIMFVQGEDDNVLLEGVTAVDNQDGDVTQSLVVEKVCPSEDGNTAIVVYVARDKSNNITKENRIVMYQKNENEEAVSEPEAAPDDNVEDVTAEPSTEEITVPEVTATPIPEESLEDLNLPAGSPRIKLRETSVTIPRGTLVDRMSYIESVTDDLDAEDSLWRSISITGDTLDSNVPGTYNLIYFVVDTNGNKSNEATLTITVQ